MKDDVQFTRRPKVSILESYDTDDKFNKGDVVALANIEGPDMLVTDVIFEEGKTTKDVYSKAGGKILLGIECGWFTTDHYWLKNIFNSKDLIKLAEEEEFSPEFD